MNKAEIGKRLRDELHVAEPLRVGFGIGERAFRLLPPRGRLQKGNINGTSMDEINISLFVDPNGRVPFQAWFETSRWF